MEHLELKVVNGSDYWKRYGNGKSKVNFLFSVIDRPLYFGGYYSTPTPDQARKMVAMALNMAHLFSTDIFKTKLYSIPRYYMENPDRDAPKESNPADMYDRAMKVKAMRLGVLNGTAEGSGLTYEAFGTLALQPDQYNNQFISNGALFVKFHEFAHLMGFADNYGAPGGANFNNITPAWSFGWTKVCDDSMVELLKAKDMPVLTVAEVDALKN